MEPKDINLEDFMRVRRSGAGIYIYGVMCIFVVLIFYAVSIPIRDALNSIGVTISVPIVRIGIIFLMAFYFFFYYYKWKTYHFFVKKEQLVIVNLISTRVVMLSDASYFLVRQGFLGQIFNYGSLTYKDANTQRHGSIKYVENPHKVLERMKANS